MGVIRRRIRIIKNLILTLHIINCNSYNLLPPEILIIISEYIKYEYNKNIDDFIYSLRINNVKYNY